MWRSNEEKKALKEKFDNPEKNVLCPSCGSPLTYVDNESAYGSECLKCKTSMWIKGL